MFYLFIYNVIEIASFSHGANNYDILMNFYMDCYRIMVTMPPLVMTDAGVEDRMFQRQVAALSCIRQMPLCAILAYEYLLFAHFFFISVLYFILLYLIVAIIWFVIMVHWKIYGGTDNSIYL